MLSILHLIDETLENDAANNVDNFWISIGGYQEIVWGCFWHHSHYHGNTTAPWKEHLQLNFCQVHLPVQFKWFTQTPTLALSSSKLDWYSASCAALTSLDLLDIIIINWWEVNMKFQYSFINIETKKPHTLIESDLVGPPLPSE